MQGKGSGIQNLPAISGWDMKDMRRCEKTEMHVPVVTCPGEGYLGGSVVEHLPSAQGVTPRVLGSSLCQAPRREPASPSAWVSARLCVS